MNFLPGPEHGPAHAPGCGVNLACMPCGVAWQSNGGGWHCWMCQKRGKSINGLSSWMSKQVVHPNIL